MKELIMIVVTNDKEPLTLKYYVLDRGDELSVNLSQTFHKLAFEHGLRLDAEYPDIVVSIGGDGTMLHAFHTFIDRISTTAFVGVHTGHLGFYADWKSDEIPQLMSLMESHANGERPRIASYPIIQLDIIKKSGTLSTLCLNEFTIKSVDGTVMAQVDINDQMFEMFRGDGICVSSPSGSTAYNKSLGGTVVHPSIEALQISEIASINNRVFRTMGSSLLLPAHHHCDIYSRKEQNLMLTIDHLSIPVNDLISVRCQVAEQKVSFVRYRPFPFWTRVRNAFLD